MKLSKLNLLYNIQKWLINKHNCYINIIYEPSKDKMNILVQVLFYDKNSFDFLSNKSSGVFGDNGEFKTLDDALYFGIKEAFKRI